MKRLLGALLPVLALVVLSGCCDPAQMVEVCNKRVNPSCRWIAR